ncbi:hypothetical protein [Methanolobus profundi]|uniref:hypothetical protein n=1 Tax=Methanolobus profundi TaxID=487685 RepID=UPI001FDF680E|nr:hypothetical protein [Methanolobus profundi]
METFKIFTHFITFGVDIMDYFCSNCKEKITAAEYKFSMKKYNRSLCRIHQKSNSDSTEVFQIKKVEAETTSSKNNSNGLSSKNANFVESMIKGRIAETLIEELFLQLKYSVFRYGMENTIPGVMNLLKGVRGDVADNIRKMPDFVIQSPKTGDVYFIEVKFRKDETLTFKDIGGEDYPYENCYFILVSKKHIKCITYKELKEGKEINPNSRNYLGNRKEFELDKDVIIKFCDFAVKFFNVV